MLIFVLILIAVICGSMTTAKKNSFFEDYCSPKNTSTVNAIFSVLIFLSHSVQYVNLNGVLDEPYFDIRKFLGQLVVATYLFYSGFGIMESYKKKGHGYIKALPVNRLFKTWYHFAIVIVIYIAVSVIFRGSDYEISHILLAFTGYTAVGNSNWYMFVTFALYILVIISFFIFRKSKALAVILLFILTGAFAVLEYKAGLADRWYNTIFCFPAGMLFSLAKPKIDKLLMKNDIIWFTGFSACVLVFAFFSQNRAETLVHYNLFAILGAVTITVLMMKINVNSSILDWFGEHIFSFFILQRIPMIILKSLGYSKNAMFFIVLSFFATVFLAIIYDAAVDKLDSLIFKKRKPVKG